MYYIEQVEGELVNAAHKLWQAVKDNDMQLAESIYRQYVDSEPPQPVTKENVWWVYNAPGRVRTASKLTVADYASFRGTEERRAYQSARLAEYRVGGKWDVVYEY